MKMDNVHCDQHVIFVPNGKTKTASRFVPLSDRVRNALRVRAQEPQASGSLRRKGRNQLFPTDEAVLRGQSELGLRKDLVLYSARHTIATDLMRKRKT